MLACRLQGLHGLVEVNVGGQGLLSALLQDEADLHSLQVETAMALLAMRADLKKAYLHA